MNRRLFALALGSALVGSVAHAQHAMIADFDRANLGNKTPLAGGNFWFAPINSNSSAQNRNVGLWSSPTDPTGLQATGTTPANVSRIAGVANATTGPVPAGNGTNAHEFKFSFRGVPTVTPNPNPENVSANPLDTFLRIFNAGTAAAPNGIFSPLIATNRVLKFDVWSKEPIRISPLIAEGTAAAALTGDIVPGRSGWSNGQLESIGGIGANATQTTGNARGGFVVQPGVWQTITVEINNPLAITLRSYAGLGNGALNENVVYPGFVSLTSFLISPPAKLNEGDPEPGAQVVSHEVYIDNIRQGDDPAKVVTGRVVLEDWAGLVPPDLELKIFDTAGNQIGSTVTGIALTPDGDGYSFSAPVNVPSDGTYRVAVKSLRTLSKIQNRLFILGAASGVNLTLLAGDVDGDDSVTVFDYDALSAAFDSGPGMENWNPAADLDGDETVTVFDYDILSRNFDQAGDAGGW